MPGEYTLEDLAKMVRIHPRTIRSYIQQGLLRGPDSLGRNARYSDYHLKRLRVIRQLKEEYNLPLSEIRRLVTMAGPDEDIQIQLVPLSGLASPARTFAEAEAPTEALSSPALDYVRMRRAMTGKGRPSEKEVPAPAEPGQSYGTRQEGVTRPLEALLYKLRDQGLDNVSRRARGEEWLRLEVTPDIEIHVRGQLSLDQLKDFEHLADLMRHILLGSEEHV